MNVHSKQERNIFKEHFLKENSPFHDLYLKTVDSILHEINIPLVGMTRLAFLEMYSSLVKDTTTIKIRKNQKSNSDREKAARQIAIQSIKLRDAIKNYCKDYGVCKELAPNSEQFDIQSNLFLSDIQNIFRQEANDAGVASALSNGYSSIVKKAALLFEKAFNQKPEIKHDRIDGDYSGNFLTLCRSIFNTAEANYTDAAIYKSMYRKHITIAGDKIAGDK